MYTTTITQAINCLQTHNLTWSLLEGLGLSVRKSSKRTEERISIGRSGIGVCRYAVQSRVNGYGWKFKFLFCLRLEWCLLHFLLDLFGRCVPASPFQISNWNQCLFVYLSSAVLPKVTRSKQTPLRLLIPEWGHSRAETNSPTTPPFLHTNNLRTSFFHVLSPLKSPLLFLLQSVCTMRAFRRVQVGARKYGGGLQAYRGFVSPSARERAKPRGEGKGLPFQIIDHHYE